LSKDGTQRFLFQRANPQVRPAEVPGQPAQRLLAGDDVPGGVPALRGGALPGVLRQRGGLHGPGELRAAQRLRQGAVRGPGRRGQLPSVRLSRPAGAGPAGASSRGGQGQIGSLSFVICFM